MRGSGMTLGCFLPRPALQPEELTNALEISNIVFTSLFALEMLLKLLVYGPFGYIKNPYNIFDGVIVVIRCDCPSTAPHLRNARGVAWVRCHSACPSGAEGSGVRPPRPAGPAAPPVAGDPLHRPYLAQAELGLASPLARPLCSLLSPVSTSCP